MNADRPRPGRAFAYAIMNEPLPEETAPEGMVPYSYRAPGGVTYRRPEEEEKTPGGLTQEDIYRIIGEAQQKGVKATYTPEKGFSYTPITKKEPKPPFTPYQRITRAERKLKEVAYPEKGEGVPYVGRGFPSRIWGGRVEIPKEQADEIRRNIQEALDKGVSLEDLDRRLRKTYKLGEYDYREFMKYAKSIVDIAGRRKPFVKTIKELER